MMKQIPPEELNEKLENSLTVIVPVYNEENTIQDILKRILEQPATREVIVIDDCSTDDSRKKIEEFPDKEKIKVFFQEVNKGKGAAIRKGFDEATSPFVIIQDADFEYNPEEYPNVIAPLVLDEADAVYGSRFMHSPGLVRYFRHEMGNKFLSFLSNVFSDIHLSDMETCYKAFKREVIQNLQLESNRFGIEVELTAKLAKARVLRIYEVPISYNPRRYDEGKKITWKDGVAALRHIFYFNVIADKDKFYKEPWDIVLNT